MANPEEWPKHGTRLKDHYHAIGVLIAAWNDVESAYSALIQILIPNTRTAVQLFHLLGNEGRWQFILEESGRTLPEEDAADVAYFLKCAAICKENRNGIAHSRMGPQDDAAIIMLTKGYDAASQTLKQYWLTVTSLRQMADETAEVASYGFALWASIHIRRNWLGYTEDIRKKFPDMLKASPERPPQGNVPNDVEVGGQALPTLSR